MTESTEKTAAPVSLTYFSDVLCIWAYISQARLDEAAQQFGEQIAIEYRFCSVFGDTQHKVGVGWADRGGYEGFSRHVQASADAFDHISIHPELWGTCRPVSSTPAHLVLKAVQRIEADKFQHLIEAIRVAFFGRSLDIGTWTVLSGILNDLGISVDAVKDVVDSGAAYADLEADRREQQSLAVQGSPTYILNDGRQKLYGNVGYGVIEANIKELLRSPKAGAASWC